MSESKLPDDMYRKGRPVDPVFLDDECLYIRVSYLDHHNKPNLTCIRFTEQSANRSKYSKPEWVLLPDMKDWGIISIKVKDVRINIKSASGIDFNCDATHQPNEDNYSHSEIRTYKSGKYIPNSGKRIKTKIKQKIRMRLIENCEVLKFPDKAVLK